MEDFCPISLCTTFYKTIAKLLANRLKKVLPDLIHPYQTAFIQGRDISDNIILVQEIFEEFSSSHHFKAFYAKDDLKKAIDSMNISFL